MKGWLQDREERLCEFFQLSQGTNLRPPETGEFAVCPENADQLALFNIEWHVIPSAAVIPLDDTYMVRLYPKAPRDFNRPHENGPSYRESIGTVFHHEWSETEPLELGFYRDARGNATCFEVGSAGPGDFSFVREVEGETDWALAGFRLAMVPE